MRLIDADALIKEFDPNGERLDPILVRSRIVQQPTAYDADKVVEEIRKLKMEKETVVSRHHNMMLDICADIVGKGGVE